MPDEWKEARERHTTTVKEMEKLVKKYGYYDRQSAFATNCSIRSLALSGLKKAKSRMFDITQLLFETQMKFFDKKFRNLADELEIFSDEVEAGGFEWEFPSSKTLELVIERDSDIAAGLKELNALLDAVYDALLKMRRISAKTRVFDSKAVERNYIKAVGVLRDVLIRWKESEALFKLKETGLKKAFENIRKEIEGKTWDTL